MDQSPELAQLPVALTRGQQITTPKKKRAHECVTQRKDRSSSQVDESPQLSPQLLRALSREENFGNKKQSDHTSCRER